MRKFSIAWQESCLRSGIDSAQGRMLDRAMELRPVRRHIDTPVEKFLKEVKEDDGHRALQVRLARLLLQDIK